MSNDGARTARCSHDGDAIHRAHDFSERRLERSGAFLRVTQKSAWHKGFCAVAILGASAGARARREIFSPRCTRELSQSDDSGLLKIFFTKASRKRARDRIRDRTRANRWSGDSRRAFGAALGGRVARKFSGGNASGRAPNRACLARRLAGARRSERPACRFGGSRQRNGKIRRAAIARPGSARTAC